MKKRWSVTDAIIPHTYATRTVRSEGLNSDVDEKTTGIGGSFQTSGNKDTQTDGNTDGHTDVEVEIVI